MVLAGADAVGSIATVWLSVVNPKRTKKPSEWPCADQRILLEQGEEMCRFLLGSPIVMLFRQGPHDLQLRAVGTVCAARHEDREPRDLRYSRWPHADPDPSWSFRWRCVSLRCQRSAFPCPPWPISRPNQARERKGAVGSCGPVGGHHEI